MRVRWRVSVLTLVIAVFAVPASAAAGKADTRFGHAGVVRVPVLADAQFADTALRPDGRVLAVGVTASADHKTSSMLLVQFTATGALDPRFGNGGKVLWKDWQYTSPVRVFLLVDGTALVVSLGTTITKYQVGSKAPLLDHVEQGGVSLSRFRPDGSRDEAFGNQGTVFLPVTNHDFVFDAVLQPDGSLVAVGESVRGSYGSWFAARFLPDGSADPQFGVNGRLDLPAYRDQTTAGAYGVTLQPDGSLVLAGFDVSDLEGACGALLRLTPRGLPDPTFGTAGRAMDCVTNELRAVETRPGGGYLATGVSSPRPEQRAVTTVLTASGAVDTRYGIGGAFPVPVQGAVPGLRLLRDRQGRTLVIGCRQRGERIDGLVTRLTAQDQPDSTFGPGGSVVLDLGPYDVLLGGALSPDGQLTVAGGTGPGPGRTQGLLYRLLAR